MPEAQGVEIEDSPTDKVLLTVTHTCGHEVSYNFDEREHAEAEGEYCCKVPCLDCFEDEQLLREVQEQDKKELGKRMRQEMSKRHHQLMLERMGNG